MESTQNIAILTLGGTPNSERSNTPEPKQTRQKVRNSVSHPVFSGCSKLNRQVEVLMLWQYVLCHRSRRTCYFWRDFLLPDSFSYLIIAPCVSLRSEMFVKFTSTPPQKGNFRGRVYMCSPGKKHCKRMVELSSVKMKAPPGRDAENICCHLNGLIIALPCNNIPLIGVKLHQPAG